MDNDGAHPSTVRQLANATYPLPLRLRRLCIAPMLDWSDRHYRFFVRLITRHTYLYTEMVTTAALLHGQAARHLAYDEAERPLALQLGGCEPSQLAQCARLAERWGYDEINLNVGCPSARVQRGTFGACLMAEPTLVADCVKAMRDAVAIDVTVKHRLGIGPVENYSLLASFVETVAEAGCRTFIVHARNAILSGLSPKENRVIPALRYDYVYRLKRERPDLEIILNGGVRSVQQLDHHLLHVDGVMVGREAYHNPWLMAQWDCRYYGADPKTQTRTDVVMALLPYIECQLSEGWALRHIARHLLGLFHGLPGARHWRAMLSDAQQLAGADGRLLLRALPQATQG